MTHASFLQGPDAPFSPGLLGGPTDSYCGAGGTKRHPKGSLGFTQMCKRSPSSCCWAETLTYSRMAALILIHRSVDKSPRCPDGSHNLEFSCSLTITRTSNSVESPQLQRQEAQNSPVSHQKDGKATLASTSGFLDSCFRVPQFCPSP